MITLQNPGPCPTCGHTRTAAVSVFAGGEHSPSVFCREHSNHPSVAGATLVVSLDGDGRFALWSRPGARFGEAVATGLMRAIMDLLRAQRGRTHEEDRIIAGPWRVLIDGDKVFAPRSPRGTQPHPWPMYASRLRASRWSRKCVQCDAALETGAKVWRARPSDRSTGPCPWRDSSAIRDCLVCESCVDVARSDHALASQTAASLFAELLGNTTAAGLSGE